MKVKVKKNAKDFYHPWPTWNQEWVDNIIQISGEEIEVETEFLFADQFNTVPIPGVSNIGLRLMADYIEEVIDDERVGKQKCEHCSHVSSRSEKACPECGRKEWLKVFVGSKKSKVVIPLYWKYPREKRTFYPPLLEAVFQGIL